MGRILAFDYGRKRIGIAVTDPLKLIANGLDTMSQNDVYDFISSYIQKEEVESFVVGLPKNMDGSDSDSMKYIEPFVRSLKRKYPDIPVVMFDERFTSVLAHKVMNEAGVKKKEKIQNKGLVDKISATIILQSYLESQRTNL